MADDVIHSLEGMKLTTKEEEIISISDEGRQEEIERCSQRLIGKFLTCKPFNKRAALSTMKKAWGLENKIQTVEVGANLFQFKFQTEFDLERVLRGGPWTFDNQILPLVRWKAGMTTRNVRFDSAPCWVQIWGASFDMVSPKVAEEIGSRLGVVEEVEKRQKQDIPVLFMRVKVALPISKPVRRGAFLAGSSGQKTWVSFKYERLALFCHHCGLLGHDLKHYAQYFALTKDGRDVACQYGEWMKTTGNRFRSPNRRDHARDVDDQGNDERRTTQQPPIVTIGTVNGGGGDESEIRDGGDVRINEANVYQEIVPEVSLANPVIQGKQSTAKDVMEENTLDKLFGPSSVGLRAADGLTKVSGNNESLGPELRASNGPPNDSGNNKIQGLEKQRMWVRRARMDYGPVENLKENANVVLGKRMNQTQQQVTLDSSEEQAGKRHKSEVVSQSTEAAGVLEHPYRAQ